MNNLNKSDAWKIQLTMSINFMSFKGTNQERVMHSKNDNIKIMINDKADEVIEKLLNRVVLNINEMRGTDFIFYGALSYWKYHEINTHRGGSYVNSPLWMKIKKQQSILPIYMIINAFNMQLPRPLFKPTFKPVFCKNGTF